jgi:uncharacterized protein YbgA (DUF1722 family)/uncharacterized protein YbbK (DUF523 family)
MGGERKTQPEIRVGISSCLLGEQVRYDGGHKHDSLITETLGQFFSWVPVCPEFELGLGVPRETLRLVGRPEDPRLVTLQSGTDHTEGMKRFSRQRLEELATVGLHGYILKKDSPSCGMERVRVYGKGGTPLRAGRGLFAAALLERFPLLPVEEEGRLRDARLRENFVERVFAAYRWRQFRQTKPRPRDLVAFHTGQKLTLLSHSAAHYRRLGQLVARAGKGSLKELLDEYEREFAAALAIKATPRKHANVLFHLLGQLKKRLDAQDKAELVERIEAYRQGLVPLIVPITLFNHHFRRHRIVWVEEQVYLNPYPAELMLRNLV